MRIFYIPAAEFEHDSKLERIAQRPFTTHSVSDFLLDIAYLENEIRAHPGLRPAPKAPVGFFRVGPSPIYSYSLIYRLRDRDAYVIAVAAPGRRPHYWVKRRI
jgi:hypothetical protein